MPIDMRLIAGLGMARHEGRRERREEVLAEEKIRNERERIGLMRTQETRMERESVSREKTTLQEQELRQTKIDEEKKVKAFEADLSADWQDNPDINLYDLISKHAMKHGLPNQFIASYKQQNELLERGTKTLATIHEKLGPDEAQRFAEQDPLLSRLGPIDVSRNAAGDYQIVFDVPGLPEEAKGKQGFVIYKGAQGQNLVKPFKVEGADAEKVDAALNELRKFEAETGMGKDERGTPEYQKTISAWREKNKTPAVQISMGATTHRQITGSALTELAPMRKAAKSQVTNLGQINKAIALLDKGVTGKAGELKAWLAPYAESAGVKGKLLKSMTAAQSFQLLTRAIVGPMRLDIIGPGPVSEWEQKLMQKLSGSGGAAEDAARDLLTYYKSLSQAKIDIYNEFLEGAAGIEPEIGKLFKPVKEAAAAEVPVETETEKKPGGIKSFWIVPEVER